MSNRENGWAQVAMPASFDTTWKAMLGEYADVVPPPRSYDHRDGRTAMVGREFAGGDPTSGDLRWHISVKADGRIPTWEEVVQTAHELRPGVVFCVGVPPRSWWMNVHEHVIHLWEVRDEMLIQEYRVNATGQAPT